MGLDIGGRPQLEDLVSWLKPPDQSALEKTTGFETTAGPGGGL